MDGRQEQVYDYEIYKKHIDFFASNDSDALKLLFDYKTDIVFLENHWEMNKILLKQDYFKLIYRDDYYSLYLAPYLMRDDFVFPNFAYDYSPNKIFKPNYNF